MGAICGFVNPNARLPLQDLQSMADALTHRGPHYKSYYVSDTYALCFRALKAETFYGSDMLETCDDHVFFAIDANLINHDQLENDLYGSPSGSDRPTLGLLAESYKTFDIDFISKLNGAFSLAILDSEKNILILARDRGGQKPLYYYHSDGLFAFASELKALANLPCIPKALDLKSLYWYLATGYISSPRSIYQNIFKLAEGTLLIYDFRKAEVQQICYDQPVQSPETGYTRPEEHLINELDTLLTKVVEQQVSKVSEPIGCFLSGGVDTSLLLSYLKRVTSKKISTFTVGFEDPLCDERPYAKKVADYLGVENFQHAISENDFLEITQKTIDLFDEPFADIGVPTSFFASKLARGHTDTVFSGDGADFLFGNYDFKYLYLFYRIFPAFIRQPVVGLNFIFDSPIIRKRFPNMPIRNYLGEDTFFDAFFIKWKKHDLKKLLEIELGTEKGKFYKVFTDSQGDFLSNKILRAQYKTYGIDCVDTKSERTMMANSLNVINPYLDNKVIEFANSIPKNLKYKKGYGKYINKKLLYRHIPEKYFERPKRGSGLPFGELTNKGMKMLINQYLNPNRLEKEGIFKDIDIIEQAIQSYSSGDYFSGHKLWTLIIFEIWLERNNQST